MSHDDLEPDPPRGQNAPPQGATGAGGEPHDAHDPHDGDEALLAALSAFVDGELPASEQAAVDTRLADDPLAASRVAAYRAQKSALRALCGADPGPASSVSCIVLRPREPWWRRFGMAAAWCVVGAGVALAATALLPRAMSGGEWAEGGGGSWFAFDTTDAFARRADIAYAVYTPEQRHPVEVGANDEGHLVAWLSKRLGKPLSVPSLQAYGYTLVGGRLLPGTVGPAAQFMYENDAGERLTLYVSNSGKETGAVRLLRDGNRHTFYWTTAHMGYALSGPPTEGKLRTIAYTVCGALGGTPAQW
ncbi:anti-sigma factor [Paraburkholderia sp. J12]|uniref:anti-sigma factor family protein n=1 Tax=Paraburkholderia sp. J12 TaxID=2805432 RepID=UPI002ABD59E3|nr:anti-sigma factor [Paraburkholderia sp. J12]